MVAAMRGMAKHHNNARGGDKRGVSRRHRRGIQGSSETTLGRNMKRACGIMYRRLLIA